jgi:hypothetical protein
LSTEFSVASSFRSVNDNFDSAFAGVYGPNDDVGRKLLWDKLISLMSLMQKAKQEILAYGVISI